MSYLGIDEMRRPKRVFLGVEPLFHSFRMLPVGEELNQD